MAPNKDKVLKNSLIECEKSIANLHLSQPSLKNLTKENFGKPKAVANPLLESLGAPHVGSFDYMLEKGLNYAVADLDAQEFKLPDECGGSRITLKVEEARICPPQVPQGVSNVMDMRIFPTEARQRGTSYKGKMISPLLILNVIIFFLKVDALSRPVTP